MADRLIRQKAAEDPKNQAASKAFTRLFERGTRISVVSQGMLDIEAFMVGKWSDKGI